MSADDNTAHTVRSGQCHCGTVRFTVQLAHDLNTALRCTCSYCRMRGAVVAMAVAGGVTVTAGEGSLTTYKFNSMTATHWFCAVCGIYTHHQRRSDTRLYAVNVACLEGVSPFDFAEVPVMDGVNHTNDTGKPTRRAGTLRYIAAESAD